MDYRKTPYFKVGRSGELEGKDRVLYRFLEIIPGLLSWGTIAFILLTSIFKPYIAAYFVILFDLYWLLKTFYMSSHNLHNWRRIRQSLKTDWQEKISHLKYEHLYHLVVFPFYDESQKVVEESVMSIKKAQYNHKKIFIVLAYEERAGKSAEEIGKTVSAKFENDFAGIIAIKHPANIKGELAGKGSNISFATAVAKTEIIDANNIPYENVIVSAFDMDTVVYKDYFSCLTWNYLTTEHPEKASFQPVPIYNNNIWQATPISRIAAFSNTFWQMIQQERPEKLVTFSSHSVSLKALIDVGYWQTNMVSEDSRIFWNLFFANNGDYRVVPMAYPVSMDANQAETFWKTMKNIYKQHRRWMWGAENVPYILLGCIKNKQISFGKKIKTIFIQLEGYWSAATNPLIIFMLGWLPLILGGKFFKEAVLSYNLPAMTRNLMIGSMLGLISLAVMSYSLLPKDINGKEIKKKQKYVAIFQWLIFPFTIIVFSSIPALDAQTRLMFGRYMGFWVTPKFRKND
jgi:hypothetical protein